MMDRRSLFLGALGALAAPALPAVVGPSLPVTPTAIYRMRVIARAEREHVR